ncbi:2-oxoglutarate dehydrogenase E1 component, partial [Coemansia sp. 'formosensis']
MASILRAAAARSQALRQRTGASALSAHRAAAYPLASALSAAGRLSGLRTKSTAAAATTTGEPHPSESFLSGSVTPYIEDMYEAYIRDPESVHASWRSYFKNVDNGLKP